MNKLEYYKELANDLFSKYKLSKWILIYNTKIKNILGYCYYDKKEIHLNKSLVLTAPYEFINDIMLHEISHAIVGREHYHNDKWKKVFLSLGGSGNITYDQDYISYKYVAICNVCSTSFGRHIKPQIDRNYSCPKCSPNYNDNYKLIFVKSN
jgi:predicted SprT family Zn-dependent metalloprotease